MNTDIPPLPVGSMSLGGAFVGVFITETVVLAVSVVVELVALLIAVFVDAADVVDDSTFIVDVI